MTSRFLASKLHYTCIDDRDSYRHHHRAKYTRNFFCNKLWTYLILQIESAWTCCKLGTQNFCLGVIYRPPNSTDIYIQKLLDQMSYMCNYYD